MFDLLFYIWTEGRVPSSTQSSCPLRGTCSGRLGTQPTHTIARSRPFPRPRRGPWWDFPLVTLNRPLKSWQLCVEQLIFTGLYKTPFDSTKVYSLSRLFLWPTTVADPPKSYVLQPPQWRVLWVLRELAVRVETAYKLLSTSNSTQSSFQEFTVFSGPLCSYVCVT